MAKNYYSEIISLLKELKKAYPDQNMGRHLSLALEEYGNLWGVSDKEIAFALEKYKTEQELDFAVDPQLDRIIDEGLHLDRMFEEEDGFEEEDY